MKKINAFIFGIMIVMADVVMTLTSYKIFGSWCFEANHFIPSMMIVPIILTIELLIVGMYVPFVLYIHTIFRLLAVISHICIWIIIAFSKTGITLPITQSITMVDYVFAIGCFVSVLTLVIIKPNHSQHVEDPLFKGEIESIKLIWDLATGKDKIDTASIIKETLSKLTVEQKQAMMETLSKMQNK